MGSRVAAITVLLAGLGAVLWVVFGTDTTDSAVAAIPAATVQPAESDPAASTGTTAAEPSSETAPDEPTAEPAPTATPAPAIPEPENYGPRMDLVELDGWLNTEATSIDDFNGRVLLVEMWTFGCHNCKARIPHNQSYYEEFKGDDFEIIGVHAPEFSYEAEVPNIIAAAADLGVDWPIALDTNKKNFRAWQEGRTNYWPRTYIVDQNGDIRYDHIGEGRYDEVRETIRYLIDNPPTQAQ